MKNKALIKTAPSQTLLKRIALGGLLAMGFVAASDSFAAPEPGLEALKASRRIQCSLQDETPATYGWTGTVFSRVPGERDKLLFKVTGMNIRQCVTVKDPKRGEGYRMVSREILLYQDPVTGELIDTWENPWTGETVGVIHVENDPVNQPPSFEKNRDGSPMVLPVQSIGNQWWMSAPIPLFYNNPLGGDYQKFVGGTYHATEMFNFMGHTDDLKLDAGDSSDIHIGWVRISDWLPWMEMRGRAGIMYFHTAGRKLDSFDQLPKIMLDFIDERYPKYREAPPVDDDRPNETSWTYFKKVLDERGAKETGNARGH